MWEWPQPQQMCLMFTMKNKFGELFQAQILLAVKLKVN